MKEEATESFVEPASLPPARPPAVGLAGGRLLEKTMKWRFDRGSGVFLVCFFLSFAGCFAVYTRL